LEVLAIVKKSESEIFPVLQPNLQISFYHRLQDCRHSCLSEALEETVQKLDIYKLDDELHLYVDAKKLTKVASFGLRGEWIFPVPYVLENKPSLLGYYRLLYGLSQKEFYKAPGIASFKRMEERDSLSEELTKRLSELCKRLVITGQLLIEGIDDFEKRTLRDLQLLTLGAQLRGGQNTKLGKNATEEIFKLIRSLVHGSVVEEGPQKLVLENAAGRRVIVAFSADPDIAITEIMDSGILPKVSIEIKGGTDVSNIHNRIGEAEKSHQKAKNHGFFEFWTIIGANVDLQMARKESPTSSQFFHLSELRKPESGELNSFRDHLQSIVGIRTSK
jgi:hypothetical protein